MTFFYKLDLRAKWKDFDKFRVAFVNRHHDFPRDQFLSKRRFPPQFAKNHLEINVAQRLEYSNKLFAISPIDANNLAYVDPRFILEVWPMFIWRRWQTEVASITRTLFQKVCTFALQRNCQTTCIIHWGWKTKVMGNRRESLRQRLFFEFLQMSLKFRTSWLSKLLRTSQFRRQQLPESFEPYRP